MVICGSSAATRWAAGFERSIQGSPEQSGAAEARCGAVTNVADRTRVPSASRTGRLCIEVSNGMGDALQVSAFSAPCPDRTSDVSPLTRWNDPVVTGLPADTSDESAASADALMDEGQEPFGV